MRNKLTTMITTAVLSLAFAISAFAATGQISFSDPSVTLGSEVNVTMKVASTDGTLSTADVTVAYDANLLEFISGTDADGGAGTIRVHGATNGAGTGTLEYNLRFRSLAAGTATVTIGTQEVYDTDDQIVDIQHEGSSRITIAAPASTSTDASLSTLNVSPGSLTPAFQSDVTSYEVTVGTDVDVLAVNATTADGDARFSITGNENLQMGENTVTITVTAADGTTQTSYNLTVTKQEGGPSVTDGETQSSETVNEGVKLSAREKTITIMNPGSDVIVPEGFAESSIDIDGHQVRGWVWKADTEHQYCIVYGMNDAGELNFYRYDLSEKTLQRYFEDPIQAELADNAEKYPGLVSEYDALVASYNLQFIIICVLGIVALVLVIIIVVLLRKAKRDSSKRQFNMTTTSPQPQPRKQIRRTTQPEDDTIDIKAIGALPNISKDEEELGVTQVIQRPVKRNAEPKVKSYRTEGLDFEELEEDAEEADAAELTKNPEASGPMEEIGTSAEDQLQEKPKENPGSDLEIEDL